jgi:hypothetical protein
VHQCETVERLGEFRVVALGGLELEPQFAELGGLRVRQQAVQRVGGEPFALRLSGVRFPYVESTSPRRSRRCRGSAAF